MLPDILKRVLALAVALLFSAMAVAWGYASTDSYRPVSMLDQLTPLLLASMFSCALVLTAMRLVRRRTTAFVDDY